MNGLLLVPVRREGISLPMHHFLPVLTSFLPTFQGLFSLSGILALLPRIAGLFGAFRWQKKPHFP